MSSHERPRRAPRPRRAHATRSTHGGQLLVLGIVLAVFALWVVPGLAKSTPGASVGEGPERADAFVEAFVSPLPDTTAEYYRAVLAGDCLARHRGPDPVPVPRVVDCASSAAFLRVSSVPSALSAPPGTDGAAPEASGETAGDGCPRGPGLSVWSYHPPRGEPVTLCLQREFRVGQCFAGDVTAEPTSHAVRDADLRSWLACDAERTPRPYNTVMVVTGTRAALPEERDVDCSAGSRDPADYWYWVVNEGTTLVCATFAPGRTPP